ncbi:YesL family protein [Virgibacillus senegalensis]|uniref:YesL family protein n=1 Tax=Virgibacillus senegalensis TaxID=1499679 RepID=UPI00069E1043|nr:YesL family protein [Virgibacillus senegalensis]
MQMGRLLNGVMACCKWITHFALLNLLWVGFTLLGGVFFGLAPSTAAMYSVARKQMLTEEAPLFRTFWMVYRKEFLRANGLVWLLAGIGSVWYFDLHFFRQFEGVFYSLMNYAMTMIGLIFIILLLYILPVFVHYDLNIRGCIKQALIIGFLHPANLVLMLIIGLSSYYFFIYFPGLIPLFGLTVFAHINMWLSLKCFDQLEEAKFSEGVVS